MNETTNLLDLSSQDIDFEILQIFIWLVVLTHLKSIM